MTERMVRRQSSSYDPSGLHHLVRNRSLPATAFARKTSLQSSHYDPSGFRRPSGTTLASLTAAIDDEVNRRKTADGAQRNPVKASPKRSANGAPRRRSTIHNVTELELGASSRLTPTRTQSLQLSGRAASSPAVRRPLPRSSPASPLGENALSLSTGVPVPFVKQAMEIFKLHGKLSKAGSRPGTGSSPTRPRTPELIDSGYIDVSALKDICDRPEEELLKENGGRPRMSFKDLAQWLFAKGFSEELCLTGEGRAVRQIARQYDLNYLDVEHYKSVFDTYDVNGKGRLEASEFECLLTKLLQIPDGMGLPAQRVKNFWHMADLDGNGHIYFEEFVAMYIKYFDASAGVCPYEDFYSKMAGGILCH